MQVVVTIIYHRYNIPPVYYGEGSRTFYILHSRLRHQCSSLKADLTKIHVVDDPSAY